MPHFLVPLLRTSDRRYGLRLRRTGRLVATDVSGAFDSRARRRGLLGREALEEGRALVIAPCSSIHTAFMRFPIDVLFMSRQGTVLKVAARVPPWRARVRFWAFAVIELPAGATEAAGLMVDDLLELVDVGSNVRADSVRKE
jgi:uncharacterized membrane protein (UPF0127 family)